MSGRVHALLRGVAVAIVACAAATPLHAQWTLEGGASASRIEHRVDAGFGVVMATGSLLGVRAQARGLDDLLEVGLHASGGRLTASEASAEHVDRTMGEIGIDASLLAMPWLALQGMASVRGYDMTPAVQRWTSFGAGAEIRLDFADGNARGLVRMALLPRVAASGMTSPDYGVMSGAGIQGSRGRLTAGLDYSLERYVFAPSVAGLARHEQLSRITLRLGGRW